jgi:hypothetical protein
MSQKNKSVVEYKTGDERYALVQWKTVKFLVYVIPMSDFVKLPNREQIDQLESAYKVRFPHSTTGQMKIYFSKLLLISKV